MFEYCAKSYSPRNLREYDQERRSVSFAEGRSGWVHPSQEPSEQMMFGIALAVGRSSSLGYYKIPDLDYLKDHGICFFCENSKDQ